MSIKNNVYTMMSIDMEKEKWRSKKGISVAMRRVERWSGTCMRQYWIIYMYLFIVHVHSIMNIIWLGPVKATVGAQLGACQLYTFIRCNTTCTYGISLSFFPRASLLHGNLICLFILRFFFIKFDIYMSINWNWMTWQ